jgi:hypothetical protein
LCSVSESRDMLQFGHMRRRLSGGSLSQVRFMNLPTGIWHTKLFASRAYKRHASQIALITRPRSW